MQIILFSKFLRTFSTTSVRSQLPNHRLYKDVDWLKVEAGFHAVVDPMEPGSILYLTEQDYIRQLRVSLSNDHTLKVLAKAGTAKVDSSSASTTSSPSTPSQNSPINTHPYLDEFLTGSRKSRKRAIERVINLFKTPFSSYVTAKKDFEGTVKSLMIPVSHGNVRALLTRWFEELWWWKTGSKAHPLHKTEMNSFGLYLAKLARTQGVNSVIQYLKIGLFVLNSYMGGKRMSSTQDLGRRIRLQNGLPAKLPLYARSGIRSNSIRFVHIWSSVLNSYKVMMSAWSTPSLETITAQPADLSASWAFLEFKNIVPIFWEAIKVSPIKDPKDLSVEKRSKGRPTAYNFLFTAKSGPNRGPALLGVGVDAFAWRCRPRNFVLEWLSLTGAELTAKWFQDAASVYISDCSRKTPETSGGAPSFILYKEPRTYCYHDRDKIIGMEHSELALKYGKATLYFRPVLRRLHALYEAAGKVRIIAIVDYWTQLVLKPLHEWMFSALRLLPQDATFDQEGKLREFTKRGYEQVYCYDLKSATDLIPLALYKELFKPMLPSSILDLWLELLVGLPFLVPKENIRDLSYEGLKNPPASILDELHEANEVRYTCGQPMGALSSWASMALVHHALVWLAAWKTGRLRKETSPLPRLITFTDYLVLGDDIVIADKEVAECYSEILTNLGIKIGFAKSFTASPLTNFANQTYLKDVNISPLSLREEINVKGLPSRSEMALRAVRRGYVDISGNGWVAPLIKLFVGPVTWTTIQKDLSRGVNHPLVSWILSALLAPATDKLSVVKPAASIKEYLATMSRKVLFWNKPISDLASCETSKGSSEFLRILLLKKAQGLLKDSGTLARRLDTFELFIAKYAPSDVRNVLFMAYKTSAQRRFRWWTREYNAFVKLVISGSKHTLDDYGYARYCDLTSLEEVLKLLHQAESELPKVPSFEDKDLNSFFSSERLSDEQKVFRLYLKQMELLRATDELFVSPAELP